MTNANDAPPTSSFGSISDLSIEQIVKCIDNHLETHLDVVITSFNPKPHPVDRYQWNIEVKGNSGYISVRIDPKGAKTISYGINNREQEKAVELALIYWQCVHACLNLAYLMEQSNSNDIPSEVADQSEEIEESNTLPENVVNLWEEIDETNPTLKELVKLSNQGYTQGFISDRLNINVQSVKNYLGKMRAKYNTDGKKIVLTAETRKKLGIRRMKE